MAESVDWTWLVGQVAERWWGAESSADGEERPGWHEVDPIVRHTVLEALTPVVTLTVRVLSEMEQALGSEA